MASLILKRSDKKEGSEMNEFKVEAMTCAHCVRAVTEAIHGTDPAARVDVDLAQKTVRVESARPRADLAAALAEAGYAPA
jgi:copper chaperone